MANIRKQRNWQLPENDATPEDVYINRREFVKKLGLSGIGAWGLMLGCFKGSFEAGTLGFDGTVRDTLPKPMPPYYPAEGNSKYPVDRPITTEEVAASYNNFYEFTTDKERVWKLAQELDVDPWKVKVGGLVHKPRTFDLNDILKLFPLEERVYRFRCVEAWSMVVPWVGFPFKKLIDEVQPLSKAKFVRLVAFNRPEQAVGQRTQKHYPWPYYEGVKSAGSHERADVARHRHLRPRPAQAAWGAHPAHRALEVRIYKSIKSIVKIEFVDHQPATFWNDLAPREYGFTSNIDPEVRHPRWSQATERVIPTGQRIQTLKYNGYGKFVAEMYRK